MKMICASLCTYALFVTGDNNYAIAAMFFVCWNVETKTQGTK